MIKSMTGFGKAAGTYQNKKISIELKTLNSKSADINTRIPQYYKEKEIEIRKLLSENLVRGKIDFNIYVELDAETLSQNINTKLVLNYYKQINEMCTKNNISAGNEIMSAILRFPDIFETKEQVLEDKEWKYIENLTKQAIEQCNEFRKNEGQTLEKDILQRINLILDYLTKIPEYEEERISTIKNRLSAGLNKINNSEDIDFNRLEQEIIFYLEKLDITEEKVRLKKHCEYFIDTMKNEKCQGRKLAFVAQEMGREINTLGSKANHSEIQKIVVMMKDELEKIKEQLLNIL
ncbi:MAG TPA: YicC family protein [Bacteroidales bacterium]|nr:YicC family protein [Bacteroidales bacterium]HOL98301.1 YicC family protein [Bacteroidales bacterium]HOM36641.1 YicC family protein [Bacteroidales bacterium]HPD24066.1 YicC family protein [Bacteroidales bacterium]HRT00069.1 YicC family protein [Bacteroidales bacterium]